MVVILILQLKHSRIYFALQTRRSLSLSIIITGRKQPTHSLFLCGLDEAMELFIELVSTVAFSLLLSFLLAKLFSTTDDHHENSDFALRSYKDVIQNETKFEDMPKSYGFEMEKQLGFVAKVVDVVDDDKLFGESTKDNFDNLQDFLSEGCGSPKAVEDVSKESRDVEIVDVTESSVEENCIIGGFVVFESEEKLGDESTERATSFHEIESGLVKDEMGITKSEEIEVLECESDDKIEELLFDDDDDDGWEGIEKSELHKVFGAAVVFVGSENNAECMASLGSDLKLQLYALHKVATEGPCHEPQPMALKVSARAKWNAWQQLGNMSPEEAMEQYVNLLSRYIHGWMQDDFGGDNKQVYANAGPYNKLESECETLLPNRPGAFDERNLDEPKVSIEGLNVTASLVHF